MELEFLGVRGRAATPDDDKLRYGGNSLSAVIRHPQMPDQFILLDAGTGLARFGSRLPLDKTHRATVLLSQLGLYNMIGFQFTPFAFSELCQAQILGPGSANFALESIFDHIMSPSYSPVYGIKNLMADVTFKEVERGALMVGEIAVTAVHFEQPDGTYNWGYRLNTDDGVLVYLVDAQILDAEGNISSDAFYLTYDADVLVVGAFHASMDQSQCMSYPLAAQLAHEARVGKLYLTYHHPAATDAQLDAAQAELRAQYPDVDITLAQEGMRINF